MVDEKVWMREVGGVKYTPWSLCLTVFLCVGSVVSAQVPPPPAPAQVVMIFKSDPKEFKSIMLDKKPFASLEVGMEYSTTWPVPAGKHELGVTAPGAEEKKLDFSVNSKEAGLLLVDLGANPDSSKAAQFPKAISLVWLPIDLPEPDQKSAKVFVYLTPEMKATSGELLHGNTNPTTVNLTPGKLNPLGEGKTGLSIGGDLLYLVNPGAPGIYVGVILPLNDGKLRSVPFSFELAEPEPEQKEKPKGPPADY